MPRALLSVLPLALTLLLPASAQRAVGPWAQFRGPGGQGVSADKGLPVTWSAAQNLLWKTDLPGAGTSSPVVLGDRIYVACYSGFGIPGQPGSGTDQLKRHLVCLDRQGGKILWKREVAAAGPEQERIREEHGYASSTPVSDGERLYVFFGKAGVFSFDLQGQQLWKASVGDRLNGWGSAASPLLFGNLVIVNASVESESLVALDRKTGKEVWRAGGIKESWNTPVLVTLPGGKTELVVAILGKVLGFDPATGAALWSCNTDIAWYMVPSFVASQGVVYGIGGRTAGGLAIRAGGRGDVTATHRLWTVRKGSNVTSPVLIGEHLYWIHENLGVACCVEARTGRLVYEERVAGAGQVYASPVAADGKIYYVTRGGRTLVLPAAPRFDLLASNDLGDRSAFNASPAVAGGRLLIRSDRALYCVGLK